MTSARTSLRHMEYADLTWIIKTCKHLNPKIHNKIFCLEFLPWFMAVILALHQHIQHISCLDLLFLIFHCGACEVLRWNCYEEDHKKIGQDYTKVSRVAREFLPQKEPKQHSWPPTSLVVNMSGLYRIRWWTYKHEYSPNLSEILSSSESGP